MKTFKKLESLGFFDWLAETHNLRDTDMKPEYLDSLPLDDIHRTVVNSMAFRWFRDNFGLSGWVDESFTTNNRQGVVSVKSPKGLEYIQSPKSTMFFETYEEAELACLQKLIEIVKTK